MAINKLSVSQFVRKAGLVKAADKLRYYLMLFQTRKLRKEFRETHPDVVLPPPYYMYETFGLNSFEFYDKSIETAGWLASNFKRYKEPHDLHILDWGCGPGRTIRHLPALFDETCRFYGTDYNKKYIKWCTENIKGVSFAPNQLQPPLPFDAETFDVTYGISIFTHLSEKMHYAWFDELMRVLKPGGILFLTLHGNAFYTKLTEEEQKDFDTGKLAIKTSTTEGHRTYAAFHPEVFVRKMAAASDILDWQQGDLIKGKPQQDVWIFQKRK